MAKKHLCFSILLLSLLLVNFARAQIDETPPIIENPTLLPQTRSPITAENASNIDLLAIWGVGNLTDAVWLNDTRLAVASSSGTWIYDITNPDAPMAVIPSLNKWQSGRAIPLLLVSPDGDWLGVTPSFGRYRDYNAGFELWHIPTGERIDLGLLMDEQADLLPQSGSRSSGEETPDFVQWLPDNRYLTAYGENIILALSFGIYLLGSVSILAC